jgi:iron complex transport system ATP-binding protein
MCTPVLELHDVQVWTSHRKKLLDGISWTVDAGEHWALLGPNGAGKSTLLRVAGGVRFPSSGTVDVLGRRLGRVDVRTLWPLIGFVNPARRAPDDLTVEEVVLTGATGTVQPLWEHYGDRERERAAYLLGMMRVDHLADRAFGTCSDGERMRALIARALMPSPLLLLLDEPSAGLDMAGREHLLAALAGLARQDARVAMVIVAHHLEDLPVHIDHALLLQGGRIVSAGEAAEVLTGELVGRTFGMPVEIHRRGGRWMAVHPHDGPPA